LTNADKILSFLFNLQFDVSLPQDVEVMHPFNDAETRRICELFYHKFYNDNDPRYCIIGINPGRFGGGVTGIPFTDPIRLRQACGIENSWAARQELSSVYVYDMIEAYGGATDFYKKFYFTAVSPLGFTKHGKNLNYYDDKTLAESIKPFAADCLRKQLSWGFHSSVAFCLGEGANYKFLQKFNKEHGFFKEIVPLSHPRFIMQYRLKTKDVFIAKYLEAFAGL
jgi:hypothetical protein